MNWSGTLSAKDIMNYVYCPRIVYFECVEKAPQATTIKEFRGREVHEHVSKKSKRTKIVRDLPKLPKRYKLPLYSKELNFQTVLDCALFDDAKGAAYPVQFKDSEKPKLVYSTQKVQLAAEAVLLRERTKRKVPFAFIKYVKSGDVVKVPMSAGDLQFFYSTLDSIRKIVESEAMPAPTPYIVRCRDCCFFNICRRA